MNRADRRDIINYWLDHAKGDTLRALVIAADDYIHRSGDVSQAFTRERYFRGDNAISFERKSSIDEDEAWLRTGLVSNENRSD